MKTVRYKLRQKDYNDLREGKPFVAVPLGYAEGKSGPHMIEIKVTFKEERKKEITDFELSRILKNCYHSALQEDLTPYSSLEKFWLNEFFGEE